MGSAQPGWESHISKYTADSPPLIPGNFAATTLSVAAEKLHKRGLAQGLTLPAVRRLLERVQQSETQRAVSLPRTARSVSKIRRPALRTNKVERDNALCAEALRLLRRGQGDKPSLTMVARALGSHTQFRELSPRTIQRILNRHGILSSR